jgi:hypothetical protein
MTDPISMVGESLRCRDEILIALRHQLPYDDER